MLKGYDLSSHQTATPSLAGRSFVILRASIGVDRDTKYDQHYANARAAGVVVEAYHYLKDPGTGPSIAAQAGVFLPAAIDADYLWVDQEADGVSDAEAQQFIDAVRASGKRCGLYHSSCGFGGVDSDGRWVADTRPASVADGAPQKCDTSGPFVNWDRWQFTSNGGTLDEDYMNPASPLAAFLRKGYVPQGQLDAAEHDIADLTADLATKSQQALDLAAELSTTEAQLLAAPGLERERIAKAEYDRINAL